MKWHGAESPTLELASPRIGTRTRGAESILVNEFDVSDLVLFSTTAINPSNAIRAEISFGLI